MYAKKSILAVVFLLVTNTICLSSPIAVTNYSYNILLDWPDTTYGWPYENHIYSGYGDGPNVNHAITIPDYYGQFDSYLKVGISPFMLYTAGNQLEIRSSHSEAIAQWTFMPNYEHLSIEFMGDLYATIQAAASGAKVAFSLFDVTGNRTLASAESREGAPSITTLSPYFNVTLFTPP